MAKSSARFGKGTDMSKIGRKAINIGNVKVEIKDNDVHYKGPKASGAYVVPKELSVQLQGALLTVKPQEGSRSRDMNRIWGLHRALLANAIKGADVGFEKQLIIEGLGFKAALAGNKVTFNLGYSHKIDFALPAGVSLEIDKTGQKLVFKSADKALVGHVCSLVKSLRPTEPYKGTGIRLSTETITRKAGKTKAS